MMIFVSLTSFFIYLLTLGPSFDFLDSPELIAFAYRLDILHPPGHPLYPLLGKLLTFIPFGSIAFKINLLSALFASMTAAVIYLLIHSFLERSNKSAPPINASILKASALASTLSIIF